MQRAVYCLIRLSSLMSVVFTVYVLDSLRFECRDQTYGGLPMLYYVATDLAVLTIGGYHLGMSLDWLFIVTLTDDGGVSLCTNTWYGVW